MSNGRTVMMEKPKYLMGTELCQQGHISKHETKNSFRTQNILSSITEKVTFCHCHATAVQAVSFLFNSP